MNELVQALPPAADSQKTAEEFSPPSSSMPADSPDSIPDPTASPAAVAALPAGLEFPEHSIAGVTVVGHRTVLRYGKKQEYFQIEDNWFSPELATGYASGHSQRNNRQRESRDARHYSGRA